MGCSSAKVIILRSASISDCNQLLHQAGNMFDIRLFSCLDPKNPQDTYRFSLLFKSETEKSVRRLRVSLQSLFDFTPEKNTSLEKLFHSCCRAKEGYFRYINSMHSVLFLHSLKAELIQDDLAKQGVSAEEALKRYLKRAKGSYALQGLQELECLLKSSATPAKRLLLALKQTFESKKVLEEELLVFQALDHSDLLPSGFTSHHGKLQTLLYHLSDPVIN
jgi:hypothetical protein